MTLQGKSSKEVESGLDKKIVRLNDDSYQFNFDNDHDLTTIGDIAEDHKQLLNHPLNEAYILPMWNKIRGKLRLNCFFYFLFLCCLTFLVHLSYLNLLPNGKIFKKFYTRVLIQKMSFSNNSIQFCIIENPFRSLLQTKRLVENFFNHRMI